MQAVGRRPKDIKGAEDVARRVGKTLLYCEIKRWEPDALTHPSFIIVWIELRLIAPAQPSLVWSWSFGPKPVPVSRPVTIEAGYQEAAERLAALALGGE